MAATRAGKGCGSCKNGVREIVERAADGDVEVDESAAWYGPAVPLEKPALIEAVRARGLRSLSSVFVAGCPRNCSEALVKEVGLGAVGDDRWEIYVGGAAGASVREGDLLASPAARRPSGAPARS